MSDVDVYDIYKELILDHGTQPRNFEKIENPSKFAKGFNPICGDKITIYINIDKNNIISKITFLGKGCAISTASASLLTECLSGKTLNQAKLIAKKFNQMLTTDDENELSDELGKLEALSGVKEYPSRVKCATLAWHTFLNALDNSNNIASTE